jgi:hypothetical protein
MSVLDNGFGLPPSLRHLINGGTQRISVRFLVKSFGEVEEVLNHQGVRS